MRERRPGNRLVARTARARVGWACIGWARVGCVLVGCALLAGRAAALERESFVAGWPIELSGSQGVFDVPLTLEVYRTADDIGQIAILDASGKAMPFYRAGPPQGAAAEARTTLSASPLYAARRGDAVADVRVASGTDRTNVTLTRPAGQAEPEIVGFVVDARAVDRAPTAIELDWRALEQPFLMEVTIEHSPTLTDWRVVGRGSVAQLSIDGARVPHDRVPIAGRRGGYYRISVSSAVPEWFVETVTLIGAEAKPALEPDTVSLAPSEQRPSDAPLEAVYFDAGGRLPVSALTLDFAAANGWARASVGFGDSPDGPWRRVVPARLFYETVLQDTAFESPAARLGRVEARYWRVLLEDAAPPQPFELELEYPREFLRFAADGSPPYVLAAGTRSEAAGPDPTFAAVWEALQATGGRAGSATLGPRTELGGPAALEVPFEFPWRLAALWALLGIGVVAVAWMAVRLARELFEARSRPE